MQKQEKTLASIIYGGSDGETRQRVGVYIPQIVNSRDKFTSDQEWQVIYRLVSWATAVALVSFGGASFQKIELESLGDPNDQSNRVAQRRRKYPLEF